MSKIRVIRKDQNYTYDITKDSGDDTYVVWERAIEGNSKIHLRFSSPDTYFRKSGNNLVAYSIYENNKIVTTTIQDYYKYYGYDFLKVSCEGHSNQNRELINELFGAEQKIAGYITDTVGNDTMFGTKGNNKFAIFNGGNDKVYDVEGNDTYQLSTVKELKTTTIIDYKGDDKYAFNNDAKAIITDNKGNDVYKANNAEHATILDKKGNDKYTFAETDFAIADNSGNDGYSFIGTFANSSQVTDIKGDDKYTVNNSEVTAEGPKNGIELNDNEGNDKYTVNYSKIYINEKSGKDTYSVSYSRNTIITDEAGKDSYKISYGNNVCITDGKSGDTKSGNDSYSFKNFKGGFGFTVPVVPADANVIDYYGKDTYSFSYTQNTSVIDYQGADTYKIKDSSDITISDKDTTSTLSSNDKYEVTEATNCSVEDLSGNDKYTLVSSKINVVDKLGDDNYKVSEMPVKISSTDDANRLSIVDEQGYDKYNFTNTFAAVTDNKGNDKYTVSNSDVKITDLNFGNDTYTVKKLNSKVVINDADGSDDKLNLSDASKTKLIYMANYNLATTGDNSDVTDGSLYIFDRTKSGFVKIENFLNVGIGGNIIAGNGSGYIESVKAGLSSINKAINNYSSSELNVGELGALVAQWQANETETDYASVDAILSSNNASDIAKFITYIQNN